MSDASEANPVNTTVSKDLYFLFRFFAWRSFKILCSALVSIHALFHPAKRGRLPAPDNVLVDLPIAHLVQGIKTASIRCEDVVQAFVDRIRVVDPLINAVVDQRFEEALSEAKAIDQILRSSDHDDRAGLLLKPLLGIPFTCKDSIGVKGMIQSTGSFQRRNIRAEEDAQAIKNLRSAGAIPLAITNVPEMLIWWDSSNNLYGDTRNPFDLSCIAGGSSGGEAALLASSGTPFGLGSDMGGSVRIPSAYCGVFGHKPSPGIVPADGMFPEVTSDLVHYVTFGPLAKRASELPLLVQAMAYEHQIPRLKLHESVQMSSLSLFWMEDEGGSPLVSPVAPEVLEKLRSVVHQLQTTYQIPCKQVHFPTMIHALDMFCACLVKADSRSVCDLLRITSGRSVNPLLEIGKSLFGQSEFSFNILFVAVVQGVLGARRGSEAYYKLNKMAEKLKQQMSETLGEQGFLLCPTMPEEAPKISSTTLKGGDVSQCAIFNVLGLPSTNVPLGLNANGLPVGIQVVARPGNDRICFAVAAALEKMCGGFVHP